MIPTFKSDEDREVFERTVRTSIGAISELQRDAETFMFGHDEVRRRSALREHLSADEQKVWDELAVHPEVKLQRWSDGLVYYSSLGSDQPANKMTSVLKLVQLAGILYLLGLAGQRPMRGGVEIAWASELHDGEIYGAAVARAYELESELAGYPRVVVGGELQRFIRLHLAQADQGPASQLSKSMASICGSLLSEDFDGSVFVDFLADEFADIVGRDVHLELAKRAHDFVSQQLAHHRQQRDSKLALRYWHLLLYFDEWARRIASPAEGG